jgi:hypothetical protein
MDEKVNGSKVEGDLHYLVWYLFIYSVFSFCELGDGGGIIIPAKALGIILGCLVDG